MQVQLYRMAVLFPHSATVDRATLFSVYSLSQSDSRGVSFSPRSFDMAKGRHWSQHARNCSDGRSVTYWRTSKSEDARCCDGCWMAGGGGWPISAADYRRSHETEMQLPRRTKYIGVVLRRHNGKRSQSVVLRLHPVIVRRPSKHPGRLYVTSERFAENPVNRPAAQPSTNIAGFSFRFDDGL